MLTKISTNTVWMSFVWNVSYFPFETKHHLFKLETNITVKYLNPNTNLLKGNHVILRNLHIDPHLYSGYQSSQQDIIWETLVCPVWTFPVLLTKCPTCPGNNYSLAIKGLLPKEISKTLTFKHAPTLFEIMFTTLRWQ